MGVAEWPFIMTRGFILVDIVLCFQRVCIREYLVTMGAAEWPFVMKRGLILVDSVALLEGLYS